MNVKQNLSDKVSIFECIDPALLCKLCSKNGCDKVARWHSSNKLINAFHSQCATNDINAVINNIVIDAALHDTDTDGKTNY